MTRGANSLVIVIVVVAIDRVLVIISLDVLAVGGGVGREGLVKQMLVTQWAYSLKDIPTHTCVRCQRTQLTIVNVLS